MSYRVVERGNGVVHRVEPLLQIADGIGAESHIGFYGLQAVELTTCLAVIVLNPLACTGDFLLGLLLVALYIAGCAASRRGIESHRHRQQRHKHYEKNTPHHIRDSSVP